MSDLRDFTGKNKRFRGTKGIDLPEGTTAQRDTSEGAGTLRFNTTTNLAEYYDGTNWKPIDGPPTISSITPTTTESAAGGNETFTIAGQSFGSGATVKFIGDEGTEVSASTVTINSSSSITAVITKSSFDNAKEPYDVKVTNSSGLSAVLDDQINVDNAPTWTTSAGSLGTINAGDTGTHFTVAASDPESDTVAYSETTSVLSTAGLSLNSSTGAITGDNQTDIAANTTYTFTLRATAGGKTGDRQFSITVTPTLNGSTSARAAASATDIRRLGITENGFYWIAPASGVTQKVPMILETGISGATDATARGFIIAANNSETTAPNANHQPRLTANTGQVGWNGNTGSLPASGDWSAQVSDTDNFSINMQDIGFDEMIFMAHGTSTSDSGNWETSFGASPSNTFASTTVTKAIAAVEFTQNIKIPTTTTWSVHSGTSVNFGSNSASSSPQSYWSRSGYVPTGFPSRRLSYESGGTEYQMECFGLMNDTSGSAPSIGGSGATSQGYPVWICSWNDNSDTTTGIAATFAFSDSASSNGWDDFQDGSGMGDSWAVEGQGANAFRNYPACILIRN